KSLRDRGGAASRRLQDPGATIFAAQREGSRMHLLEAWTTLGPFHLARLLALPSAILVATLLPGRVLARGTAMVCALAVGLLDELAVPWWARGAWVALWLLIAWQAGRPERPDLLPRPPRRHAPRPGAPAPDDAPARAPGVAGDRRAGGGARAPHRLGTRRGRGARGRPGGGGAARHRARVPDRDADRRGPRTLCGVGVRLRRPRAPGLIVTLPRLRVPPNYAGAACATLGVLLLTL